MAGTTYVRESTFFVSRALGVVHEIYAIKDIQDHNGDSMLRSIVQHTVTVVAMCKVPATILQFNLGSGTNT